MPRPAEQLDSRTEVVTPENIAFEYRAAGPFTRVGAYLMDIGIQVMVVVLAIIVFMLCMMAIFATLFGGGGGVTLSNIFANLGGFAVLLLLFAMQWFYGAYFELKWNGQTPGKRMLGLRVLQIDGRPINVKQAVLRNLIRFIDAQPPLPSLAGIDALVALAPVALSTHLAGFTATAFTKRHQRLGDLVCGTMVVAEDRSFVAKVDSIEDPGVAALLETIPASFVPNRSLSKALAHYIGRRRYFGPARRQEIARHVGVVLIDRLNLPANTDCDLLLCALYTRAFGDDLLAAPPQQPQQPPIAPELTAPVAVAAATASNAARNDDDEPTDWDAVPLG